MSLGASKPGRHSPARPLAFKGLGAGAEGQCRRAERERPVLLGPFGAAVFWASPQRTALGRAG